MGEISFAYHVTKTKPRHVQAFHYKSKRTTEYGFAYQRYITLSDTSIINSPVAITKVATGLSNLSGLFVTNREPMMPDMLDGFNITKDSKKMLEYKNEYVRQEGHSMIENTKGLSWYTRDRDKLRQGASVYEDGKHLGRYLTLNDYVERETNIGLELPHTPYLNVFNNYFGNNYDYGYIWNSNIYGYMDGPTGNIIYQIHGELPEIYGNIKDDEAMYRPNPIVNHAPVLFGETYNIIINKLYNTSTSRPTLIANRIKDETAKNVNPFTLNVLRTIFARRPDFVGNHIDVLLTKRPDLIGNIYSTINSTPHEKSTILPDIYAIETSIRTGIINEIYNTKKETIQGNKYSNINTKPLDKYAEVNNEYIAFRYENKASYFDLDNFTITEMKHGFLCNDYIIDNRIWTLNISYDNYFGKRDNTIGSYTSSDLFSPGKEKDVMITDTVYGTIDRKNAYGKSSGKHGSIGRKSLQIKKKETSVFKDKLLFNDKAFGNIHVFKILKDMSISDTTVYSFKDRLGITLDTLFTDIYKVRIPMMLDNSGIIIHKISKDMDIFNSSNSVYRLQYDLSKLQDDLFIFKVRYDLYIKNTWEYIFRITPNVWSDITSTQRTNNGTAAGSGVGIHRVIKDAAYFQIGLDVLKEALKTDYITDYEFALKDWLPLGFVPNITDRYSGMIIPVSKLKVQAFIDDINEMVSKYNQNVFITPNVFASVIPKDVAIPQLDLFCDKDGQNVMIDYYNHWLIKEAVKASVSRGIVLTKGNHYAWLNNEAWISKSVKNVYAFTGSFAEKDSYKSALNDELFAYKDWYLSNLHDDFFVDKEDKVCYYYYDVIADKKQTLTNILKMLPVPKEDYTGTKLFDIAAVTQERISSYYDSMLFPTSMLETNLSIIPSNIPHAYKDGYEMSIYLQDFGNWVWSYENPDPFTTTTFGIDELLLPENDTRYEDFEDIIFDKQTLLPRDPVKIIDDTTFIARFPVEHPITKYADVGKIYGDSAEQWDNYFGIQTDVMHEIFLKYYQIWQSKIFEFATMTMHQSTNKMLNLLYTWITLYYPVERMEQALRVFRQIRWYSESAIIKNSQYIIKYEFDSLKSNLHTGRCDIPNDLGPDNPTMYIERGVIRNNPAYIGQEASVTFEIDLKKNTTFIFSLSNQVGTVKVYVNDQLAGLYPKSGIGYTINLPYTGQTNYVKIVKEANHNLDKNFYIGYIEVPGASFKDLSITFDPVLRAGNKPLDEVAKKLIAYANLHANRNEMYQVAKRNNSGIIDTYQKMNDYWKNHNQNQSKGKRLIIKQT